MGLVLELSSDDAGTLQAFADKGRSEGSKFPGMSYEEGVQAVIEVMEGDITVEEAVGE